MAYPRGKEIESGASMNNDLFDNDEVHRLQDIILENILHELNRLSQVSPTVNKV